MWLITSLLIVLPLIAFSVVRWYQDSHTPLPVFGKTTIDSNGEIIQHQISSFTMMNQDDQIYSSDVLKNKIVIANFFFSACSSVCPKMMSHIKSLQNDFADDTSIAIISFTVDPKRDNSERLYKYASNYNINKKRWNLLTGDKKEIYKLARNSFYLTASDGDGGDNDFIHSEQVILIDKYKRIRGYYDGTDDKAMEKLQNDIKKLEYEK